MRDFVSDLAPVARTVDILDQLLHQLKIETSRHEVVEPVLLSLVHLAPDIGGPIVVEVFESSAGVVHWRLIRVLQLPGGELVLVCLVVAVLCLGPVNSLRLWNVILSIGILWAAPASLPDFPLAL